MKADILRRAREQLEEEEAEAREAGISRPRTLAFEDELSGEEHTPRIGGVAHDGEDSGGEDENSTVCGFSENYCMMLILDWYRKLQKWL